LLFLPVDKHGEGSSLIAVGLLEGLEALLEGAHPCLDEDLSCDLLFLLLAFLTYDLDFEDEWLTHVFSLVVPEGEADFVLLTDLSSRIGGNGNDEIVGGLTSKGLVEEDGLSRDGNLFRVEELLVHVEGVACLPRPLCLVLDFDSCHGGLAWEDFDNIWLLEDDSALVVELFHPLLAALMTVAVFGPLVSELFHVGHELVHDVGPWACTLEVAIRRRLFTFFHLFITLSTAMTEWRSESTHVGRSATGTSEGSSAPIVVTLWSCPGVGLLLLVSIIGDEDAGRGLVRSVDLEEGMAMVDGLLADLAEVEVFADRALIADADYGLDTTSVASNPIMRGGTPV